MWWFVSVVLTGSILGGLALICRSRFRVEWAIVAWILLVLSWAMPSIGYYTSRTEALQATTFYETVVKPNVVEVHEAYVVVSSTQAFWQGDAALTKYNNYLAVQRRANAIAFWGRATYPVPKELKFVYIGGQNVV